jgi:hypothetical protein
MALREPSARQPGRGTGMTKGVGVGVNVGVGTGVCVGVRVLVRAGVRVGLAVVDTASADVVGVARAEPPQAEAVATPSTARTATTAEPRLLRISSHLD